ncbi:hypothetical protein [Mesorhizobium helmanticense]|uniref:hypothetical protein n=1 Tax=Mesorhizobium helmanticense TaxID=1776423 RepID=UPI003CCA2FE4
MRVIDVAFRAWRQLRSEAFWANEGVSQVGEKEQSHTATEDIVDKHVAIPPLKTVASFDVGEGQGEKQNPYPDNDDVHGACSLFIFAICISNLRQLVLLGFAHCVEILRPAGRIHTKTPRNDGSRHQVCLPEYGSKHHKGSRRDGEERNKIPIKISEDWCLAHRSARSVFHYAALINWATHASRIHMRLPII